MIKKFISIENIGRLAKSSQKGPELNRYNLAFAENGRGKTTLCAILRSLDSGEPAHILERKTLREGAGNPAVVVRLENGEARFQNGTWNKTFPHIAIFDAAFVSQNVHAGEYVGRGQRGNLLEVIVGEAGVILSREVTELDAKIRDKSGEITRAKRAFDPLIPNHTKFEEFIAIKNDLEIQEKISAAEQDLKTALNAVEITKRTLLHEIEIPDLPETILPQLAKTIKDISEDAVRLLKEHVELHQMHKNAEAWLSYGLKHQKNASCPFCGQKISGLELIDAYNQYFSDSYTSLVQELEATDRSLDLALGSVSIETLGRRLADNSAQIEFWKSHLALEVPHIDFEGTVTKSAGNLYAISKKLLDRKQSQPLQQLVQSEELVTANSEWQSVQTMLAGYNTTIKKVNGQIQELKKQAAKADAESKKRQLRDLNVIKLRNDEKMAPLCEEYLSLLAEKARLDKLKEAAKLALDAHADKMIKEYEISINRLLKGFGAGFQIGNSKKTYVGGTATSNYQILINDHAVDLGDDSTPIGTPSFRTSLSSGDKSTLALAFFLAKFEHDANKQNCTIVFDDPFNSQDRSRRERTAELLKFFGSTCKQMILLSHDPHFLKLVHSKLIKKDTHCIQLSRIPDNNTTIEEWDLERETQDGYFREHAALHSYMLSGAKDLVGIVRKIRPVIEGYLRYRFPNTFADNMWLGDMIGKIRADASSHPMFPALAEIEGINDYSKRFHHDTNPGGYDSEQIDDGELRSFVDRTLAIVGGY